MGKTLTARDAINDKSLKILIPSQPEPPGYGFQRCNLCLQWSTNHWFRAVGRDGAS